MCVQRKALMVWNGQWKNILRKGRLVGEVFFFKLVDVEGTIAAQQPSKFSAIKQELGKCL